MGNILKRSAVGPTLAALVLTILFPVQAIASNGRATLEGLLLDVDSRPAAGHRVHLIDPNGTAVAQADVDAGGLYSFEQIASGDYSLGIENPQGQMAPVDAPPLHLEPSQLVRRDVKLMNAASGEVATSNYGMGVWWAGLTRMAKVWTVIGVVVVAGITYAALDDDDPSLPASAF